MSKQKLCQLTEPEAWIQNVPSDTDALLISLFVKAPAKDIEKLPNLKYIGVYGTNLNKIDAEATEKKRITCTRVTGYCDEETAEFCFNKIKAWGLNSKVGIIGLGSVGIELARQLRKQDVDVSYWSRSPKPSIESEIGVQYKKLPALLESSEILSLHMTPDLEILKEDDFQKIKDGVKILNTCIGAVMHPKGLESWIKRSPKNFLSLDSIAARAYPQLLNYENVEAHSEPAYLKESSLIKRRRVFIDNLKNYLSV